MPSRTRQNQPLAIAERSWAIFTAYYYEERALAEIAATWHLSPAQVRRIVEEVDAQLGRARGAPAGVLGPESPLEDLSLSVRTRNSLHGLGCQTIDDILRLDLSTPLRGMGLKTRQELLTKLARAGFPHPGQDAQPGPELRGLERSLERLEQRIGEALGAVAKEVRTVRGKLRAKRAGTKSPASRDGDGFLPRLSDHYSGNKKVWD